MDHHLSAGPHLGHLLTSYCFGSVTEDERTAAEQHLMSCELCWQEFQRLDAAVRTLRSDPTVKPAMAVTEAVSLVGLSSRLRRPLGGHALFAITIAILYGLEWTAGIWTELGYAYRRFGSLAWALSAPVGIWVIAAVVQSFYIATQAARAGRIDGLRRSAAVMLSMLMALVILLMMVLPAEPTIAASFQTRTASAGFFKDVVVIFAPLLVFFVIPFNVVVRLQQELAAGRFRHTARFLGRHPESVYRRGDSGTSRHVCWVVSSSCSAS